MHPIQKALRQKAKPEKIAIYKNYHKAESIKGEKFLGVSIPDTRIIAQSFVNMERAKLIPLLSSPVHEDRMCALMVLSYQYQQARTEAEQKEIVNFYLAYRSAGNTWDLIDCIADRILGPWLIEKDKALLYMFAHSPHSWERRIAIITTYYFIKQKKYKDTLVLAEILINDQHDLMHKAVGWMLREIGKRDEAVLKKFLAKHYKKMPRTMLRYSIERFPEKARKQYLKGRV